jgi:hypothetical protein
LPHQEAKKADSRPDTRLSLRQQYPGRKRTVAQQDAIRNRCSHPNTRPNTACT